MGRLQSNNSDKLTSVTSLLDRISDRDDRFFNQNQFFCFRGQSNAEWGLKPSLFRDVTISPNEMLIIERDIYRDFQDKARPFAEGRFDLRDPWEMMCFAQHYGVPTRLLDWTSNPLVGLYFAVFEGNTKNDAALWCMNITLALDPKGENNRSYMRGQRLADLPIGNIPFFEGIVSHPTSHPSDSEKLKGKLAIIQAPDINDRIRNQSGLFSVYIPDNKDSDKWDHSECRFDPPTDDVLIKLTIPASANEKIRDELERLGMTPDQIYPDLEGVGKFLKYWRLRRLEIVKTKR